SDRTARFSRSEGGVASTCIRANSNQSVQVNGTYPLAAPKSVTPRAQTSTPSSRSRPCPCPRARHGGLPIAPVTPVEATDLGFVPEPALELAVTGVARHQDFDGHRGPVQLPTREHPGEPALPEQALEVVRADGAADEVGGPNGRVSHEDFTNRCRLSKLLRSQQLGNWIDVRQDDAGQ